MRTRGIYRKFVVTRTDGSSEPGGKHEHCAYFVLDLEHDEFALAALKAYARVARKTHPKLAADIELIVDAQRRSCGCREASCPHMPTFGPADPNEQALALMHRAEKTPMNRPAAEEPLCRICHEPRSAHVATDLGPLTHPREARGEGKYILGDFGTMGATQPGQDDLEWERWVFVPKEENS